LGFVRVKAKGVGIQNRCMGMRLRRRIGAAPAESGFAIIEVLVSGVVAVIAAAGIMALMQVGVRTAADQRARSQSYAIAQEDQARLRATRIPSLRNLTQTRTVTVGTTTYTVKSTGKFVNDATETLSCGTDSSTEDYVKISSEVTWPNMSPIPATVIHSIISPPSNSLNPKTGTLVFNARNAKDVPISGLSVSGTGAGTFGGSTDSKGCAVFLEQASGDYSLKISGGATGIVDVDGNLLPATKPLTVNPQTTTSVDLLYDKPGWVKINFQTTNYAGSTEAANATNLIAFNTGMSTAKSYAFSSATSYEAKNLFPFTSADSFYVGSCTENNPTSGTGLVSTTIPSGAAGTAQNLVMPALLLNVQRNGTATNSIKVLITPQQCSGTTIEKTTSTVSSKAGRLSTPELPWGSYRVCATTEITTGSGWTQKTLPYQVEETFDVKNTTTTKTWNITSSSTQDNCV
jgi:Tfp pilus assembly protein PilV